MEKIKDFLDELIDLDETKVSEGLNTVKGTLVALRQEKLIGDLLFDDREDTAEWFDEDYPRFLEYMSKTKSLFTASMDYHVVVDGVKFIDWIFERFKEVFND